MSKGAAGAGARPGACPVGGSSEGPGAGRLTRCTSTPRTRAGGCATRTGLRRRRQETRAVTGRATGSELRVPNRRISNKKPQNVEGGRPERARGQAPARSAARTYAAPAARSGNAPYPSRWVGLLVREAACVPPAARPKDPARAASHAARQPHRTRAGGWATRTGLRRRRPETRASDGFVCQAEHAAPDLCLRRVRQRRRRARITRALSGPGRVAATGRATGSELQNIQQETAECRRGTAGAGARPDGCPVGGAPAGPGAGRITERVPDHPFRIARQRARRRACLASRLRPPRSLNA